MNPDPQQERIQRLHAEGALTDEDVALILSQPTTTPGKRMAAAERELPYAGFWIRVGAQLIDTVCVLTFVLIVFQSAPRHRLLSLYLLVPHFLFILFCSVWLVKRFGGSPGKLALGLRVRRTDGSAVGYREALGREIPGLGLALLLFLGQQAPQWRLTDAAYLTLHALPVPEREHQLGQILPAWYPWVNLANSLWVLSEFVVLLTNRQRRALQDFLAGTVVVHQPAGPPLPVQPRPAE